MHKTVVRNKAYQTKSFTAVEHHNERKILAYPNSLVVRGTIIYGLHYLI